MGREIISAQRYVKIEGARVVGAEKADVAGGGQVLKPPLGGGKPGAHEFFEARLRQPAEDGPGRQAAGVSKLEAFKQRKGLSTKQPDRIFGNIKKQLEVASRLLDAHLGCKAV